MFDIDLTQVADCEAYADDEELVVEEVQIVHPVSIFENDYVRCLVKLDLDMYYCGKWWYGYVSLLHISLISILYKALDYKSYKKLDF